MNIKIFFLGILFENIQSKTKNSKLLSFNTSNIHTNKCLAARVIINFEDKIAKFIKSLSSAEIVSGH